MSHAVVLGAGMGGLLAARTLAEHFDRVTVVERDKLDASVAPRRGVPQGRHLHLLLPRGGQVLNRLFPGLTGELTAAGAPLAHHEREVRVVLSGLTQARPRLDAVTILASRPLLESTVRARVAALGNVKILDEHAVTGLITHRGRVVGARVSPGHSGTADAGAAPVGSGEEVEADLVVDALGRAGRTKAWLAELGHRTPPEDQVKVNVAYASRFLRMPADALGGDRVVLVAAIPGRPRAMVLARQEGDRWMLSLGGLAGDHPPLTGAGYLDFAATVAPPDVHAALRDAVPLSDPVRQHFPASVRRRYERLRTFPPGLLPFADSLCSFNPLYGQGMTVAALESEALAAGLRAGTRDLPERFFRAAARVIAPAWLVAAAGDLALPEVPGPRPARIRVLNTYIRRLHRVAHQDPTVATPFAQVITYLAPPARIAAPTTARKVLRGPRP
ncbi:FAD-dependent oxidoreductase [Bailinhaonella thermotolerans]|nr:hypothetical protein [Bailinhaonella thermotolerans]